jgi:hypothetical protein
MQSAEAQKVSSKYIESSGRGTKSSTTHIRWPLRQEQLLSSARVVAGDEGHHVMFFAGTGQAAALLRAPSSERIASAVCSGETW